MKRKDVLAEAEKIITEDRNIQYGEPHDVFDVIAQYWTTYLDVAITPDMVADMMMLFKIARLKHFYKADTYIDIIGYGAIACELAGGNQSERISKEKGERNG